MKLRPQSAKHRHVGPWERLSNEITEIGERPEFEGSSRSRAQIYRANMQTSEYGRVMPKKMYHDKEKMYSESLQLKQSVNELESENTKLKTKVSILEREKDKMARLVQAADLKARGASSYGGSYGGSYGASYGGEVRIE